MVKRDKYSKNVFSSLGVDVSRYNEDPTPSEIGFDLSEPIKRKRAPSRNLEHWEQVRFFDALEILKAREEPEAFLVFAVPNGSNKSPYLRNYYKAEGLIPGVPDIIVPVSRGGYVGLAIELKIKPNKLDPEQEAWRDRLIKERWIHCLAYSAVEAWATFCNYCKRPDWLYLLADPL